MKVAATPAVVFANARALAAATESADGVEAKANSYVRYTVNDGQIGMDYRLTPDDGGTMVDTTATLRYRAGDVWSGGIFTPLIAPSMYFMLRRMNRKLSDALKTSSERESLSAGQKLKANT